MSQKFATRNFLKCCILKTLLFKIFQKKWTTSYSLHHISYPRPILGTNENRQISTNFTEFTQTNSNLPLKLTTVISKLKVPLEMSCGNCIHGLTNKHYISAHYMSSLFTVHLHQPTFRGKCHYSSTASQLTPSLLFLATTVAKKTNQHLQKHAISAVGS